MLAMEGGGGGGAEPVGEPLHVLHEGGGNGRGRGNVAHDAAVAAVVASAQG